jgi:site-specific DNA-methyltransferase (adenine-specific)
MGQVYMGDCLEIMKDLQPGSIDLICTDLPYGTTACPWDSVIDLQQMWPQVWRVLKPNGAFITTAGQPFTSVLIASSLQQFKYTWVWKKESPTGAFNAKQRPMKVTEDVAVFSESGAGSEKRGSQMIYNPQGLVPVNKTVKRKPYSSGHYKTISTDMGAGNVLTKERVSFQKYKNYPGNILYFARDKKAIHPTQKPVALLEYLVNTYSNPGDIVLDIAAGSGTTGVACQHTGRDFILIEKDPDYYQAMCERLGV